MFGLYLIFDDVSDCICSDIFKAKNEKVALLGFQSFINETVIKNRLNPKSYSLHRVGHFDENDVSIIDTESKEISDGLDCHSKLVSLGVLTDDIESVNDEPNADKTFVLDNGEI